MALPLDFVPQRPFADFKSRAWREEAMEGRNNAAEDRGHVVALERDVRANYAAGFDFSESAKRLVEERTGCAFSSAAVRVLQGRMFGRKDGLWFFEDQISDRGLRDEIVGQCQRWLAENPIVTLSRLGERIGSRAENLEDDFDRGKYAEHVITRSEWGRRCDFGGKRGGRICFLREVGVDRAKRAFAEKVESLLRERLDIVPLSELADTFPMVSADWMAGNLAELIPDAILEEVGDKNDAFKLLEFYYLPDDFAEAFQPVVEKLAEEGEVLSVSRILNELNDWYGYDFRANFALSEDAFKQIATRVDRSHRGWTGAILGGDIGGVGKRPTFKQIVEKQFPRVFTMRNSISLALLRGGGARIIARGITSSFGTVSSATMPIIGRPWNTSRRPLVGMRVWKG